MNSINKVLILTLTAFTFFLNAGYAEFTGAEMFFTKPYQTLGATNEKLKGEYVADESVETFDGISYEIFYKDEVLPTRFVTAITSNKQGDIFIGTKDIGVFRFSINTSKRHWFKNFPADNKEIAVHDMIYDEVNHELIVATTAGVFRIKDEPEFYDASCKFVQKVPRQLTLALTLDSFNGLWVGTSTGLYDPSGTHFSSKDGLPSDMVQSLKADSNGNIWIGTDGGLAMKNANTIHQIDFDGTDKRWIYDLDQESPIELYLSLEKYQLIARAIFAGIRKNAKYDNENKEEIDAQMNKIINVDKPGKNDIIVAASDGLYRVDINSLKVTRIAEGWFNALAFANTGQFYALDNELQIKNFSPTVRLLGKFHLARKLIGKLISKIKSEIIGEVQPDFLDEKTIEEMQGKSDEEIFQALIPYVQGIKTTGMHFDVDGRMWVATDGGGLYCFSGRLNTSNFFIKPIAPATEGSLKKKRFLLQSEMLPKSEHSDLTNGHGACQFAHKQKMGFYPLKVWMGKTSELRDDDWQRIGKYIGANLLPNDCIKFIGLLPVDPWQFIPCIHLSDIPDMHSSDKEGFADLSKETLDSYENYNLPVVLEGVEFRETYPENHPQSLIRKGARPLPPSSSNL